MNVKSFVEYTPRPIIINFSSIITNVRNKLDCLSLKGLSSLALCLWVRPRAYLNAGAPE